jgi:hypothetical protein
VHRALLRTFNHAPLRSNLIGPVDALGPLDVD